MRKMWYSLGLLMVLALLIGACAAPAAPAATEGETAAAAEEPAAAEAVAAEPTPVVNAFGDCDDPFRMWHGLTGSDGAVFSEMLTQFAEANPDFCMESQGIPWDLFFQKYPTSVAAGDPPGERSEPFRVDSAELVDEHEGRRTGDLDPRPERRVERAS